MKGILLLTCSVIFSLSVHAAVIYTPCTSTCSMSPYQIFTNGATINIDFDGDLTNEVIISLDNMYTSSSNPLFYTISTNVFYSKGSNVTGAIVQSGNSNLPETIVINDQTLFSDVSSNTTLSGRFFYQSLQTNPTPQPMITTSGPWNGTLPTGYIGIKFTKGANTHYGWIKFVYSGNQYGVAGWAYESIPGQGIVTGQIVASLFNNSSSVNADLVSVFPNPCKDKMAINNLRSEDMDMKIYSPMGVLIYSGIIGREQTFFYETKDLKEGVYYVHLRLKEMKEIIKVVKE